MNLLAGCSVAAQDDVGDDGLGVPSDAEDAVEHALLLHSGPKAGGPMSKNLLKLSPVVMEGGPDENRFKALQQRALPLALASGPSEGWQQDLNSLAMNPGLVDNTFATVQGLLGPSNAQTMISKTLHQKFDLPSTNAEPLMNSEGKVDLYGTEFLRMRGIKNAKKYQREAELVVARNKAQNRLGNVVVRHPDDVNRPKEKGGFEKLPTTFYEQVDEKKAFLKYGSTLSARQIHLKEKGLNPGKGKSLPPPLEPIVRFAAEQNIARQLTALDFMQKS